MWLPAMSGSYPIINIHQKWGCSALSYPRPLRHIRLGNKTLAFTIQQYNTLKSAGAYQSVKVCAQRHHRFTLTNLSHNSRDGHGVRIVNTQAVQCGANQCRGLYLESTQGLANVAMLKIQLKYRFCAGPSIHCVMGLRKLCSQISTHLCSDGIEGQKVCIMQPSHVAEIRITPEHVQRCTFDIATYHNDGENIVTSRRILNLFVQRMVPMSVRTHRNSACHWNSATTFPRLSFLPNMHYQACIPYEPLVQSEACIGNEFYKCKDRYINEYQPPHKPALGSHGRRVADLSATNPQTLIMLPLCTSQDLLFQAFVCIPIINEVQTTRYWSFSMNLRRNLNADTDAEIVLWFIWTQEYLRFHQRWLILGKAQMYQSQSCHILCLKIKRFFVTESAHVESHKHFQNESRVKGYAWSWGNIQNE